MNIRPGLSSFKILAYLFFGITFLSCNNEIDFEIDYLLNPNKISPLTATLIVSSNTNGSITTKINGDIPIETTHIKNKKKVELPLIGLYANKENSVDVTFESKGSSITKTILIKTQRVPGGLPDIEINKLNKDKMEPGFHACDFHMANRGKFSSLPFIFDDNGDIRWYLGLSYVKKMAGPFQKFRNGDIVLGTRTQILKFDMMGKVIQEIDMDPDYGIHHDMLEMPNGNILALVGKRNQAAIINGEKMATDSDFTIVLEKNGSKILKEWDNAQILDVSRDIINTTRKNDWIHTNGIHYNSIDSSMIVSGKNQGVFKHSWNNKLSWILAPHKDWGKSGREGIGFDTKNYLLTAVDAEGKAYNNSIQLGETSHEDFDFPWGQHAVNVLSNGNLLLFDNGSPRNFKKENSYSRVVEYKINEKNRTVQQVWQYGKERGIELYSPIVCDVDLLPSTNNILMTSGYIRDEDLNTNAKIIEIDKETNEEVFEATLSLKTLKGSKQPIWGQTDILYRSERMPLIHASAMQ